MTCVKPYLAIGLAIHLCAGAATLLAADDPLPGTKPLDWQGDIASKLVDDVDAFLLKQIAASVDARAEHWKRNTASPEAYNRSIAPNRAHLRAMLGMTTERIAFDAPALVATVAQPALVGRGEGFEVYAVRWPVLADPQPGRERVAVHGEGLLVVPTDRKPIADVVAIPDSTQSPEHMVGLIGEHREMRAVRALAQSGCRVLVPSLIDRSDCTSARLTRREYLYRPGFELGHHLVGTELQKALAGVDWFARDDADRPIAMVGYGDGGMIALYAGALDTRIAATVVSGYFEPRESIWTGPIDRNVFDLLREFGDAELASMIWPRTLIVDASKAPEHQRAGGGGAPYAIVTPTDEAVRAEADRARKLIGAAEPTDWLKVVKPKIDSHMGVSADATAALLYTCAGATPADRSSDIDALGTDPTANAERRRLRQFHEIEAYHQTLLIESPRIRDAFMKPLYTAAASKDLDAYDKVAADYRQKFYDDVIGRWDLPVLPFNARTRQVDANDKWVRYEVVLDVFDGVFAYGLLTIPRGIAEGERRPVVVCQHGLEGRPQDTIGEKSHQYYKAFATTLAERGFVTFAPQNLYIFGDRFRTLQRKSNAMGRTLFSIITPQHQQIVDWLQTLPQVDPDRIGFYGLSYGGKTAMRVPALVTDYALSICSADFNEWVWKNAATDPESLKWSYVDAGEYEIFEWNLGGTFNYAEMAALICPRPFMVERGQFDPVAPDHTVAYEYAKVRYHYQARLGIGDRTEIEYFTGPHSIHGVATYHFLHRQLRWPVPQPND